MKRKPSVNEMFLTINEVDRELKRFFSGDFLSCFYTHLNFYVDEKRQKKLPYSMILEGFEWARNFHAGELTNIIRYRHLQSDEYWESYSLWHKEDLFQTREWRHISKLHKDLRNQLRQRPDFFKKRKVDEKLRSKKKKGRKTGKTSKKGSTKSSK